MCPIKERYEADTKGKHHTNIRFAGSEWHVEYRPQGLLKRVWQELTSIATECSCRAEHGAAGGEHLKYIHDRITAVMAMADAATKGTK